MFGDPKTHIAQTQKLAKALTKADIYKWLVTQGYFPESYVMPPCFKVSAHPKYGRIFFKAKKKYKPKPAELRSIHFPKTELTDKTFGIIDPELHSDIACLIAQNWLTLVACLFHKDNKVCSYSFPLPLDARNPGAIGRLRSGRMIYEFIEMAENDLAAMAYNYGFIIKTDIKNFYPSIYTHSIAWALHGKKRIRKVANRFNYFEVDWVNNSRNSSLRTWISCSLTWQTQKKRTDISLCGLFTSSALMGCLLPHSQN